VCHERFTISGEDQTNAEFAQWCAPDAPGFVAAQAAG
jgi:hypothetical protein